jgi:BirA family biotin operon repressor/biotin-[acetyl-CoA-carboxylase] ligase
MYEEVRKRTVADIPIFHYSQVDSTQDVAKNWWQENAGTTGLDGKIISVHSADHQIAGRGRRDREWVSQPHASLIATFVIPVQQDDYFRAISSLMLTMREVLDPRGNTIFVKWPNDLVVPSSYDRKISGCLTEIVDGALMVGIGVNLTEKAYEGHDVQAVSTSELGILLTAEQIIDDVVQNFDSAFSSPDRMKNYEKSCATIGTRVVVEHVDSRIEGDAICVSDNGELTIQTDSGTRTIIEGDVIHLRSEKNSGSRST